MPPGLTHYLAPTLRILTYADFFNGEPYSVAHTKGKPLSDCPRKSIQPCIFHRNHTTCGSLWKKKQNLLTLSQRFEKIISFTKFSVKNFIQKPRRSRFRRGAEQSHLMILARTMFGSASIFETRVSETSPFVSMTVYPQSFLAALCIFSMSRPADVTSPVIAFEEPSMFL